MRTGPLSLLLTTLLFAPMLAAEEGPAAPAAATSSVAPMTIRVDSPADAAQTPAAESPAEDNAATDGERDSALLSRLRQENQRLKLKLKEAQAQRPDQLLSEQQMWFAVGASTALLAFIIGRLSAGRRNRRQSQWA